MLYDEPGPMLTRAGELLASGEATEMTGAQLRAIGVQLKRLGAMWADLFATLAAENAVLVDARDAIAEQLAVGGHRHVFGDAGDPDDPVARYRHLLCQLNDVVALIHEHRRTPWGSAALTSLRAALHRAGSIEAVMVDKAWAA